MTPREQFEAIRLLNRFRRVVRREDDANNRDNWPELYALLDDVDAFISNDRTTKGRAK